jgi:serine/threonine-protein kinase RsbW
VFVELTLRLPRTVVTVTAARRVLDHILRTLGVTEDCRYDLSLALTEACANAVEHAGAGADYCVTVKADRTRCTVEIVDSGKGMVNAHPPPAPATAHRGRGMAIIRACSDSLSVDHVLPHGVAVRFSKRLALETGHGVPEDGQAPGGDPGAVHRAGADTARAGTIS